MNLNGDAVDCVNRRYASTNQYGFAFQTTVIFSVNTVIFIVRFVVLRGIILNKIDKGLCDDFVLACIGVSACSVVLYLLIYFSHYTKIYFSSNITNT